VPLELAVDADVAGVADLLVQISGVEDELRPEVGVLLRLGQEAEVDPDPEELRAGAPMLDAARVALETLEPFTAEAIEAALRAAADELGLKPRQAFQPIRVAITGSRISPGLFESIALLGRAKTLARLSVRAA